MKSRNSVIDIMKGIAILCVIAGHIYWLPEGVKVGIYAFHIPLFFIIAGYFTKTCENQLSGLENIRQNGRRLLLPYLITATICCLYELINAICHHDINILTHAVVRYFIAMDHTWEGTLFDTWVAPIWFLLALFWAKQFFYYLSKFGVWTLPLCVVISLGMELLYPYFPLPWGLGWGIEALVFIAVGWAYRKYSCPLWIKVVAIACCFISMYLGRIDFCEFRYQCWPIDILGACGGTLIVYYIAKGIEKTFLKPFLAWCGQNSLSILCVHNFAMDVTTIHLINKYLPFYVPTKVYHCVKHALTLLVVYGCDVVKAKYRKPL